MKRFLWFLPALIACAAGLFVFWYKVETLGVPLTRNPLSEVWSIRNRISFMGDGKRVRVSLRMPQDPGRFKVLNENFSSGDFGLATLMHEGERRAEWSRKVDGGPYLVDYELRVVALKGSSDKVKKFAPKTQALPESLAAPFRAHYFPKRKKSDVAPPGEDVAKRIVCDTLREEDDKSKALFGDLEDPLRRINRIAELLTNLHMPTRLVQGVLLKERTQSVVRRDWLQIQLDDAPRLFDPDRCRWINDEEAERFFIWSEGPDHIVDVRGASEVSHNVVGGPIAELSGVRRAARTKFGKALLGLSIYALPVDAQAIYRTLLLLPVGALVIAFLRAIVGMTSFGTFMPVLVALSFRETGLELGLAFFVGIIAVSLIARKYFEVLQLLIVPRLSAMLHVVLILLVAFGFATHIHSGGQSLVLAVLPVVVVTMTIERTALLWEEAGPRKALWVIGQSIAMALLCYLVISHPTVEYMVFMFPELLLVGLAISVLLGRYSGFRLTELYRFRSLAASTREGRR